jgi:3'-phosphoadenosine 5'-phosphosulfate sulfotransferase (PAPS reductase)/FAD synthetase
MSRLLDRIIEGCRDWRDIIEDRPLVVSVSGGKDSTAMALWLIEQGLRDRCHFVFADTGWEHPSVYEYLKYLEEKIGPIHRATSSKYPEGMSDLARKKGIFPGRTLRFCTTELKVVPIKEYLSTFDDPINVVGIRAEESKSRAAMDMFDNGGPMGIDTWRPIIEWGVEQVVEIHSRNNVRPCGLYLRDKNPSSRVGCYPCIYARKNEIAAIAENDPWRIDEIRELEKELGCTFFHREAASSDGSSPASIDEVVSWARTSRGGRQFKLFDMGEPGCRMWGLCDMGTKNDD